MKKEISITEEQKKELDKRLKEYQNDPDKGLSWKEFKNRLLNETKMR